MLNRLCIIVVVVSIVVVGFWMYQYMTVENYVQNGFPYARLGGGYNTQLFSPCVSKRCAGGPYMYTSNPYLQAVCQGVTNEELAQVACGKAFHGRPVHFDYSSLSDDAWDNALCNTPSSASLCVL
jgi:hypothetical protein